MEPEAENGFSQTETKRNGAKTDSLSPQGGDESVASFLFPPMALHYTRHGVYSHISFYHNRRQMLCTMP